MKLLFAVLCCYVALVSACTNNALFEYCMKTAKSAVAACDHNNVVSCACSAQKQLLACYSECAGDDLAFELEEKQLARVRQECAVPGAEQEARRNKDTDEDDINEEDSTKSNEKSFHAAGTTGSLDELPSPIHINDPELERSHAAAAISKNNAGQTEGSTSKSQEANMAASDTIPTVLICALLGILCVAGLC